MELFSLGFPWVFCGLGSAGLFWKETLEGDNAYEVGPTTFVPQKNTTCHMGQSHTPGMEDHPIFLIPSRELTYPPKMAF